MSRRAAVPGRSEPGPSPRFRRLPERMARATQTLNITGLTPAGDRRTWLRGHDAKQSSAGRVLGDGGVVSLGGTAVCEQSLGSALNLIFNG